MWLGGHNMVGAMCRCGLMGTYSLRVYVRDKMRLMYLQPVVYVFFPFVLLRGAAWCDACFFNFNL